MSYRVMSEHFLKSKQPLKTPEIPSDEGGCIVLSSLEKGEEKGEEKNAVDSTEINLKVYYKIMWESHDWKYACLENDT